MKMNHIQCKILGIHGHAMLIGPADILTQMIMRARDIRANVKIDKLTLSMHWLSD